MDVHYQDFNPNSINPFYRSPEDFRLSMQWFYFIALLPALPSGLKVLPEQGAKL